MQSDTVCEQDIQPPEDPYLKHLSNKNSAQNSKRTSIVKPSEKGANKIIYLDELKVSSPVKKRIEIQKETTP